MYELFLTHEAQRFYERAPEAMVRRINRCFDSLRENPYDHPNIKSLKDQLAGLFRYRLGAYRVIYRIDKQKNQVVVLLIVHRSKAYR